MNKFVAVLVLFALGIGSLSLRGASDADKIAAALQQPASLDVLSTKTKKTFSATVQIEKYNSKDGSFTGRMTWPKLGGAIHKIEGKISGSSISFTEKSYIKKGSAHLNCSYSLKLSGGKLTGSWEEPGYDKGTASAPLPAEKKPAEPEKKPAPQAKTVAPAAKPSSSTASSKPSATTEKKPASTASSKTSSEPASKPPTSTTAQSKPDDAKKPSASSTAASSATAVSIAALPARPKEEVPADAKGYYKLVETEFYVTSLTDGSFSYGPKSNYSSFSTTHNVQPVKDASGPFNWSTQTQWSVPEILVPGKSYKFLLSGSSSRDQYSAILALGIGSKAPWALAAVRRGLTARFGGDAVPDVSSSEFSFTVPKEIADWKDKTKWKTPANVRVPDSELNSVYQSSGSARVTTKTPSSIPVSEVKLTVKDWMYGEGALAKIVVGVNTGSILNRDAIVLYTYKWQDSGSQGDSSLVFTTDPASRKDLRADGKDSIILKARISPSPKEKPELTRNRTRTIKFSGVGEASDWLSFDNKMMSGDWHFVTVRASARKAGATPPSSLVIKATCGDLSQTITLKTGGNPALALSSDRFDCLLNSKRTAQIKVTVDNPGASAWKISAAYEKNARHFASFSVKQTGNNSAVIDLKEAGLKPEPGDDNVDYATILVVAEQKGAAPLEAKLTVRLLQEGLFISDLNRSRDGGQFKVYADGKNKPTELDFLVFTVDAKTQQVANLTKNSSTLKKIAVDCLEKESSPAARLLASGGFKAVPSSIRPLNEPAGTLKMSFAKELPGDGSTIPCRFRIRFTDRKETSFSAPFTIGIVTTANGPGGKNWREELERCETIINKFVPLTYRPRMQSMLDKRKQTLGAEGLAHLRKKIWSAAAQLTLAEGGKGYENEAAWANTITESLEWTKWAGDFAFDVAVGIYTGPYGSTSAGILKEVILSAIEAYQDGKSAKEWAWEYICTIPELVEGKVVDVDAFEKWGVKSKAKAWAIYVGYHFLKNLTAGEGIVAALKETAKTVGENVLTGWLGDQIEANKDRRVSDIVRGKK